MYQQLVVEHNCFDHKNPKSRMKIEYFFVSYRTIRSFAPLSLTTTTQVLPHGKDDKSPP